MPGIVGLVSRMPREQAEAQLRQMTEAIRHESFYTSGMLADPEQGAYVGWTARKGSFADGMPLRNETGEITMVFSGEEFSAPDVLARLKDRGHAIPPDGSSCLVHRYEDEIDFPKSLNGRFHGVVVDRTHGKVLLFNDRYGLQRVYYHETKDAVYFASEAKAILKVCPQLRAIDHRGLAEFVTCGCVLENRTLFPSIYALPPGSAWTFRAGLLESKGAYFDPKEWEQQAPLEAEDYYQELRHAFVRNLPRYFDGKERAGVSLTGGLDTRIIMAWHKAAPNSVPCYTFGSMYRDNEDVKLARRVAKLCGQPHQVIVTGQEFLSNFPHYAERATYLADGGADLSRSPDLYVNEKARAIAPVRIVGTFGSEIMLSAVMFKAEQPVAGLFQPISQHIGNAKEAYHAARNTHPVTFVAFRQSPWHHSGLLALEQTQVAMRSPFLDNDFVKIVYRAPGPLVGNEQTRIRLIREGNPVLAGVRTDGARGGLNNGLTRAHLEFLFKAEYAYDVGMPQWVARIDHLFASLRLERIWLGRHKIFHFRVWYRDQLAKYVRDILLDARSLARPYVDREVLRAVVNGHIKGNRNYTTEIHRLLSLELAHRLFVDSN